MQLIQILEALKGMWYQQPLFPVLLEKVILL
jgi:hypothetical protein